MRKVLGIFILVAVSLLININVFAEDNNMELYVDTKALNTDVEPLIKDGIAFVPARAVLEELMAVVSWDESEQKVTAVKDENIITLIVGSDEASKNSEKIQLESYVMKVENRVFVPASFFKDCFKLELTVEEGRVTLKKNPEYFLLTGHGDQCSRSPEHSSEEPYPDYIKREAQESIESISSYQDENTVTFTFMPDIHYTQDIGRYIRTKRTFNAYRDIAQNVKIDKLVLGGDNIGDSGKEYRAKLFAGLREQMSGLDYYPINGNHDDGTIWDVQLIKSGTATNHSTHSEMYDMFYDHLPDLGVELGDAENSGLYYMQNDMQAKVRYIFLDTHDIPYIIGDNGKLKYTGQWNGAISQKQLDWLVNKALKFDEEGWSVVVFAHVLPDPRTPDGEHKKIVRNLTIVRDVLDAYKNGTGLKGEYYENELKLNIDVDFSDYTRADISSVIMGHYHLDKVVYSDSYIPYIYVGCAVMKDSASRLSYPRIDGDKSEILFDVITIDKAAKRIYLTRVGAGSDRVIEY